MIVPLSRREVLARTPVEALATPWLVGRRRLRFQADRLITADNRLPASSAAQLGNVCRRPKIEGSASATRVHPGERPAVQVQSERPAYSVDMCRLGSCGGRRGRQMARPIVHPFAASGSGTGSHKPAGLRWPASHVVDIPRDSPRSAFFAKLTGTLRSANGIVWVVRGWRRPRCVCSHLLTTYRAYNAGAPSLSGVQSRQQNP
jgi:hypothetical protein